MIILCYVSVPFILQKKKKILICIAILNFFNNIVVTICISFFNTEQILNIVNFFSFYSLFKNNMFPSNDFTLSLAPQLLDL